MAKFNASTIGDLAAGVRYVERLIELAKPRGALAEAPRGRVAHVSRTAKWLKNAIGNLIHETPELMAVLGQHAVKPPVSNEELEERAKKFAQSRSKQP